MNLHRRPLGNGTTRYRVIRPDWAEIAYQVGFRLAVAILLSLVLAIRITGATFVGW